MGKDRDALLAAIAEARANMWRYSCEYPDDSRAVDGDYAAKYEVVERILESAMHDESRPA